MADQLLLDMSAVLDDNGNPVAGGTVTAYDVGTSLRAELFSDRELATPMSNPVRLDAGGRYPLIYVSGETPIRLIVRDAEGAFVREVDEAIAARTGSVWNDWPPGIASKAEFGPYAITSGDLISITHGMSGAPYSVQIVLECLTAEHGYAEDERIYLVGATSSYDNTATVTTTQILIRLSDGLYCFSAANQDTGGKVSLTNANWQLYVRAIA